MTRPRIMSLCSGYGGLDSAAEAVTGGVTVAFAEYDADPSRILAHHWPDVPNLRDVKTIDWEAWTGRVDIVTAGYPCQPFSHAGKRAGEDDPRHLWPAVLAGVRALRPRLVLLENVAGHLSLGFGRVLGDLAEAGYDAEWVCLRAADVGAPHGRARLFIAAHPQGDPWRVGDGDDVRAGRGAGRLGPAAGGGAATDASGQRHGPGVHPGGMGRLDRPDAGQTRQRERAREEPRDRSSATPADAACVGRGERRPEPARRSRGPETLLSGPTPCPTCGDDIDHHDAGGFCAGVCGGHCTDPQWGRPVAPDADSVVLDGSGRTRRRRGQPTDRGDATPDTPGAGREARRRDGLGTREQAQRATAPDLGTTVAWGAYEPAIRRWEHILGRPAPRPTDPGRNGRERLSPRFVEFLMGLPDGHVTAVPGLTRNAQLKALGNGVVPQQAAAAYRILLHALAAEAAA